MEKTTPKKRIRAVIDTNILVGGLFSERSGSHEILKRLFEGQFDLVISEPVMAEAQFILGRIGKAGVARFSSRRRERLWRFFEEHAIVAKPKGKPPRICQDPDDDKLFAAAIEGGADFLVSNDGFVLDVWEFEGVRVMRPDRFLKELENA